MSHVVRAFWHGAPLSVYEKLCLASFVRQGHEVELYAYTGLDAPPGVRQVDARAILPESELFAHRAGPGKGSFSTFSNRFRYKLLFERGGTWTDLDVLCLRSFDDLPAASAAPYDDDFVANGILVGFPAGHPLMGELYRQACDLGRDVAWAESGPILFTRAVREPGAQVRILPRETFYPIHFTEAWKLLVAEEAGRCEALAQDAHAVHWWNEEMRRMAVPKDRLPPEGAYLQRRAVDVLGQAAGECWPAQPYFDTWIRNYLAAKDTAPLARYLEGKAGLADFLRDLGAARIEAGDWRRAADLLEAAHAARPGGTWIRLLLGQALLELGETAKAVGHLEAARGDAKLKARAEALLKSGPRLRGGDDFGR